jgi:hypothetical protein
MALLPRFRGNSSAAFWEQHINDENSVELISTDSLPLVIALNGHTLSDYPQESRGLALERASVPQASIRGEESEQIELLNIRRKPLKSTRSAARTVCAKRS